MVYACNFFPLVLPRYQRQWAAVLPAWNSLLMKFTLLLEVWIGDGLDIFMGAILAI